MDMPCHNFLTLSKVSDCMNGSQNVKTDRVRWPLPCIGHGEGNHNCI